METAKAHARRLREGWFAKYAPEHLAGLDIGCQRDPLNATFRRWDRAYGDGDATYLEGVPDAVFSTVYASHVLEHLERPVTAIRSWWRVLKPGGHLIIVVPHRDLYEKKKELPSKWNAEHKWFFLPHDEEPPHTLSLLGVLCKSLPNTPIVPVSVLMEGFVSHGPETHSEGEYSIEAIVRKDS